MNVQIKLLLIDISHQIRNIGNKEETERKNLLKRERERERERMIINNK